MYTIRQRIGIMSIKKHQEKVIPSIMQNIRNITKVSPKLISDETFFEKRKRNFGTFIFVKIAELARREPMPPFVESVKKEKTIFPQKR